MIKPILEMKRITKTFPGVVALDDVNLNVYEGKIMALLGENGAGKSTLMKILSGVYQKTSGEMLLHNHAYDPKSPKEAMLNGIVIIHQELNLIENLSVAENIFLSNFPSKRGIVDWELMNNKCSEVLKLVGLSLDPKTLIKNLSIGHKQMIEIAKALSQDAKVIIMDEPTDALTDKETSVLFNLMIDLKQKGHGIVYISHRLNEIFEICDDVTILRDGKFIEELKVADINEDKLIELMVGRRLDEQYIYRPKVQCEEVLSVENLSNEFVRDIHFSIDKGEVLGVAGLMGAGRTELAKSIFGAIPCQTKKIVINGREVQINSENQAIANGIVYVSEDRKKDGIVLTMSVQHNITLSALSKLFRRGKISRSVENEASEYYTERISIKTPHQSQPVKLLSGGNQQKVAIAKALMIKPKVLILDEPTRGVDVGAKKEIYEIIDTLKEEGLAILVISSELSELQGICDRIMVMHNGKIKTVIKREKATQEIIMKYAVGVE